ncbi:MAG: hypothetical protein H0U59_02625 [Gemmatimonadaceae bacterium]|nr:hypothetical protein [Gemmatimonadaceae bacterium]
MGSASDFSVDDAPFQPDASTHRNGVTGDPAATVKDDVSSQGGGITAHGPIDVEIAFVYNH